MGEKAIPASQPWQLEMFRSALKKQLKLEALLKLIGDVSGKECLLITCGDNNGALNWHFREYGGNWTWGELSEENIPEMSSFLEESIHHLPSDSFPFANDQFDCVVSIDVLEHLPADQPFLSELARVLAPDGRALVTVPNGSPGLLANRIKWRLGMTPEVYGHTRAGYTVAELEASMAQAGLWPLASGGYSRLFTELVELAINYGYVFVLARKKDRAKGQIAPTKAGDFQTHGRAYRLYQLAFPLLRLFSKLDGLLSSSGNNAVIVVATKEASPG